MTGKELIELIQKNHAEELPVKLIDSDSLLMCGRLDVEKVEIEEVDEDGWVMTTKDKKEKVFTILY